MRTKDMFSPSLKNIPFEFIGFEIAEDFGRSKGLAYFLCASREVFGVGGDFEVVEDAHAVVDGNVLEGALARAAINAEERGVGGVLRLYCLY